MSFPQLETDISFVDFLTSQPCLMISHCAWLSRCISILPPENTTMSSASILILDGESLWNHHCSSLSHSFSWLNPYFSCLKTPFIILKSPFFLEHDKNHVKTTQLTQMFASVTSHLRCPVPEARGAARRDGLQRQRHPRRRVRCRGEPRGVARGAGLPAVPRCPGGSHHSMGKTVEPWGCGENAWVDYRVMCLTWGWFYGWCWLVWTWLGFWRTCVF